MNKPIRSLLASILDYAGLFPPAGLEMVAAVSNYAAYRACEHAWMLGRFIVPVARLEEFETAVEEHASRLNGHRAAVSGARDQTLRLSVLAATNLEADLAAIADFNGRHAASDGAGCAEPVTAPLTPTLSPRRGGRGQGEGACAFLIDTIELKATRPDEITKAMQQVPAGLCAYVEVPVSSDESMLAAARAAGARVKVRTGGVTRNAFPTCDDLAQFLVRCARAGVPFKATAGLHHPVRSVQRLTYADDSPCGTMHGFLNVFLAAAGVRAGMTGDEATRLLAESGQVAFRFGEHGASWGRYRWSNVELRATREEFAISFGSCSFQEPIDDLRGMRLL